MIPPALVNAFLEVTKGLAGFAGKMSKRNFEVRPLLLRPAAIVCAWAGGLSWDSILRAAEIEEGDLATLILRTADNLRHIRNLKDVFPEAAATAGKSIEQILREPVASVY